MRTLLVVLGAIAVIAPHAATKASAQIAIVNPSLQCDGRFRSHCAGPGTYHQYESCSDEFVKTPQYQQCLREAEEYNRSLTQPKLEKPGVGISCTIVFDDYLNRASDIILKERSSAIVRWCNDGDTTDADARLLMAQRVRQSRETPAPTYDVEAARRAERARHCEEIWAQQEQGLSTLPIDRGTNDLSKERHGNIADHCGQPNPAAAERMQRWYDHRDAVVANAEQQYRPRAPQGPSANECETLHAQAMQRLAINGYDAGAHAMANRFNAQCVHRCVQMGWTVQCQ